MISSVGGELTRFQDLNCTQKYANFVRCDFKVIGPPTKEKLDDVEIFGGNNVTIFDLKDLTGLYVEIILRKVKVMEIFMVENCSYIYLRSGMFKTRSDLEHLVVANSKIKSIPTYTFTGAPNLIRLYLNNDGIETIAENAFSGLKKLKYLELNKNSLQAFYLNTFKDLVSLEILSAFGNRIRKLDNPIFERNKKLSHINFRSNGIETIHPCLFHNLGKFTLDLSENYCFHQIWRTYNTSKLRRI